MTWVWVLALAESPEGATQVRVLPIDQVGQVL